MINIKRFKKYVLENNCLPQTFIILIKSDLNWRINKYNIIDFINLQLWLVYFKLNNHDTKCCYHNWHLKIVLLRIYKKLLQTTYRAQTFKIKNEESITTKLKFLMNQLQRKFFNKVCYFLAIEVVQLCCNQSSLESKKLLSYSNL